MRGFRFYLEHRTPADKRKRAHMGTVFALCLEHMPHALEGGSAVFDRPNSPVCWGSASRDYLRHHCRRVSEATARAIHPRLFAYLEAH